MNGALVLTAKYVNFKWTFTPNIILHHPNTDSTGAGFYDRKVQRSLWIENYIYTKSKCLIKANNIWDIVGDEHQVEIDC